MPGSTQMEELYQQRLERIPGDGGWQTVGIDTSGTAAWTTSSADYAWTDDVRRRIRALGVVAYVRGTQATATLRHTKPTCSTSTPNMAMSWARPKY